MTEFVHVVGARPNFPKMAPVLRALDRLGARQFLIHTGQHYDDALSESFFRDLQLPRPDLHLGVGSGSQARQTAALLSALDEPLGNRPEAVVVVYGDINSTLAAALVSSKHRIPLAHVEAGLRSFDRSMPEEINRVVTDSLSDTLFVTSEDATENLVCEGIRPNRIHFVGNPMIDTLLDARPRFSSDVIEQLDLKDTPYAVVTLHRPSNVDDPGGAVEIVEALRSLASDVPIALPLHPRGRATLVEAGLNEITGIHVLDPQPYLRFMGLVESASLVVTDSGGLQEETTILNVPCLTLRPNTERPVTITHGTNQLTTIARLSSDAHRILGGEIALPVERPPLWDGRAGERIAHALVGR